MKIFLKDHNLDEENYRYNVHINGENCNDVIKKNKKFIEIQCPENSFVEIEICNWIFQEKKANIYILFYWILSLITGTGEENPFGLPFNALLKIKDVGKEDIFLEVNSVWKKEAFNVEENKFFSPKGSKKKWFLYTSLPSLLLSSSILIAFIAINVMGDNIIGKAIILSLPILCELWFIAYAIKVLRHG